MSQTRPPRNITPHIRLNSGTENILAREDIGQARPVLARLRRERPPAVNTRGVYGPLERPGSSERLLVPSPRTRDHGYRDSQSEIASRSPSPVSSASSRSSWSSQESAQRDFEPYKDISPRASLANSTSGDELNTQTISQRYNITPSASLLLFPSDIEKDDALHDPNKGERDLYGCQPLPQRGIINMGGLVFLVLGLLALMVGYPAYEWYAKQARLLIEAQLACQDDPACISDQLPLLKNLRTGLIDPDTPHHAMKRTTSLGKEQVLVFSDEFNANGRTFYDGDDPYWQGVDLWYGVTADIEWYDPDAIITNDGTLNIRFDAFQNHKLNYRSGMLQSWNQLCFKGGYMEASVSLPGRGDTIGFWPGVWTMGNLGRAGYAATTDGMWPYSYHDTCDYGITPNQSQSDGISYLPGMRLPACTCLGEDHPSPGISRSAPEIDAIEASVGYLDPPAGAAVGTASQSAQFAPFDIWYRPDPEFMAIYDPMISIVNEYQGGVYQQAASIVTNLNNDWYNGKQYQTYGFEYEPGSDGYVTWYVGQDKTWTLDARAIRPNGNVGQRVVPMEPMYVIINFGMSAGFAQLNLTGLGPLMPATMRIDYVRIYQDSDKKIVTCDPQGYPTTQYIADHIDVYQNPNYTQWHQTSYSWPKNSFMHSCSGQH